MDNDAVAEKLGALAAEISSVDRRLQDHIVDERTRDDKLLMAVEDVKNTLAQATGARKVLVWLLATLFAAIALAKGWIIGK